VAWKWGKETTYAIEGSAFVCGAAVQWLRDGLKIIKSSGEIEALAQTVSDCAGVQFVPALTGLGAPYWDAEARGTISGLTRGATAGHLARATLEGMALQNVGLLKAMEKDLKSKVKTLKVDGGASANNLLMQMQSDFFGVNCTRPKMIETTSAGAAFMAGLGAGVWKSYKEIKEIWKNDVEFSPRLTSKARASRWFSWEKAVEQARHG
jgi:glycerol kinase